MLSPVRPSVLCLSVTRVDQSKTVEVRIMQLSSQIIPMTVGSFLMVNREIPTGQEAGAPNDRGVGKIRSFQPIIAQ